MHRLLTADTVQSETEDINNLTGCAMNLPLAQWRTTRRRRSRSRAGAGGGLRGDDRKQTRQTKGERVKRERGMDRGREGEREGDREGEKGRESEREREEIWRCFADNIQSGNMKLNLISAMREREFRYEHRSPVCLAD